MPLSATDANRAERALKRSILRRDNTVAQFNKLSQLSENIEHDRDQKTLFRLKLRDLDSLLANFHADQDDILDQLIMLSREEEYAKVHASIESTVSDQFYRVQVLATNFDLQVDQTIQSNTSRNLNSNIQLPKIQLPQFNGELPEWRSFRDTFTSLVHENSQLSDIEKFHYLISCLSGHALPIVRSVPLTGANYLVAWEALNTRLDNKRLLVNCYLDAMFAFCPLNNESLSGLKRFLDTFQQNIAAINALGVEDLAGFLLFYIASRCLDAQSKRLFESEQHANETTTIDILLTFVQNRCQILQNATSMLSHKQPESSKRSHNKASLLTSNTFDQVHQKSFKSASQNINNIPSGNSTNDDVSFAGTTSTSSTVVLGTAVVHIRNSSGFWSPIRVLIDSGSQISVITNACVTRLGLPRRHCKTTVVGLAHTPVCDTKGVTYCTIKPEHSNSPLISCEPIIMSKITGSTPSVRLNSSIRRIYTDIQFADPNFDVPGPVDFLLGADIHSFILKDGGRVIHTNCLPSVYETIIGWILSGKSMSNDKSPLTSLMLTAEPSIDQLLQSFWSMEEPSPPTAPFTDDDICEELFSRTTKRDENGRYVLSFPFRSDPSLLGDSYHMDLSRFYNLERKLQRDTKLYNEYRAFMSEYEQLGHMKRVSVKGKYFIPHHAVVKYVADQLKLSVVFDASANSTSQTSLNKLLYIGPIGVTSPLC
ncbi:DUF1758 domain-containing protein [Aphis craccivora]|uniref:DUF1758 domain-containing protein n=1 Tax=Aphis craccivora TaxID=307492 RepID=A0A6G0VWX9_APHCR|nr:DUF1758 domain-containing protein [Aphis craccivora]